MVWCAEIDLATTLTGPARAQAGQPVTYEVITKNQGDLAAANVQQSVQLIAGLTNVTINGVAAGTRYNAVSGLLTLAEVNPLAVNASSINRIGFTMPATGQVTGQARSTTSGLDIEPLNNNGTLANANVTTVQNRPPVANSVTVSPSIPINSDQVAIPSLSGTDPDGNNTIASYQISALPPASQGLLYVNGVLLNTTNFSGLRLTPTQAAQLTFDPSGTFVGNVTFQYTVTDDLNVTSAAAATYTIPVSNQPPVATSATNAIIANTAGATTLSPSLSGTDADGTVVSFLIKSLPGTGSLTYNGATVAVGASIPANQLSLLRYTPAAGQISTVSFTFSAVDNNNAESAAVATYTIPVQSPAPTSCAVSYFDNTNAYSGLSADYVAGTFSTNSNSTGDDLAYFVTRAGVGNSIKRVDPQLNFTGNGTAAWGNILPPASGSATDLNLYSARYRGSIFLAKAGTYTFYTSSDDGSYLWIDGAALPANDSPTAASALVNNGGLHGNVEVTSTTVRLSAGFHNILLFFTENTGGNVFTFSYAGSAEDGTIIAKQIVPNSILCAGKSNLPPVAVNVTNSPAIPNSYGRTTIAPLQGTDADGTVANYIIATLPLASQGVLSLNGTAVVAGQQLSFSQAAQLQFAPTAGYVGNATFTFHAVDNVAQRSNEPATYTIPVSATTTITGTVFEDVNYGGGAGRSLAAATAAATGFSNIGNSGATVELYDNATGLLVSGITATATTSATGVYTFTGVPAGNYSVRVVNSTVTSVRPLTTGASAAGLLAVQTFVNGDVNRVGGEAPAKQDANANTGTQSLASLTTDAFAPQSITTVAVAATPAPVANVNFGFNFDVVTNTNSTGQGSLRQFILNSNALANTNLAQNGLTAGVETSIFMIGDGRTTNIPAGLRSGVNGGFNAATQTATITLASALPTITDSNTAIDGSRQTAATGNTNLPTAELTTGPEVVINFNSFKGLEITGAAARIASLGLTGARGDASFTQGVAVYLNGSINTMIADVTATGNQTGGIRLNAASGAVVMNNVILGNTTQDASADGIQILGGTSNASITGNTLSSNRGNGIEFISGTNATSTISGNIIRNNGAGITITSGNNNLFSQNTITGNTGDGIEAAAGTLANRFTQNSISGNGDLGIDLSALGTTAATGDGVTKNADGKTTSSGANGLYNFPIFSQAVVTNSTTGSLRITGYAPMGSVIELFLSDRTTAGFGQGQVYLVSLQEGGTLNGITDQDPKFISYSGLINGLDQGSETNASRFYFDIPLSTLTSAQRTALTANNARLTATATRNGTTTSEFSGNILIGQNQPLPVELTKFEAVAQTTNALLTWATASEKNNDRFEVERSSNGTSFERVGTVKGNGTTSSAHQYSFVDAGASRFGKQLYYRLRQVDADGTEAFSPVRAVTFAPQAAQVLLYPNPAVATTTLDLSTLPAGTYAVTLIDVAGRTLTTVQVQGGVQHALSVGHLPAGTYLLQVRGAHTNLTQRLVKQN